MTHFWAKTTAGGEPGISVYQHLINVGCVATCIAELCPQLLEYFQLRSNEVGALSALHDIGKVSPGFQQKCKTWLEINNLLKVAVNGRWDAVMESDHGVVSHAAIQDYLLQSGAPKSSASYLAAILGSHHGRMKFHPDPRGLRAPKIKQTIESHSGIDWNMERQKIAQQIFDHFHAESSAITIDKESHALWWLAGLTAVADWIGSDERFFPPEQLAASEEPRTQAMKAIEAIGFRRDPFIPGLTFHDLFHDPDRPDAEWTPNDMQEKAVAAITGPGVYVIEAPMGMGKTEAALWAAYRLLVAGRATGIYFALPTQMTSNRIHLRMNQFMQRIAPNASASRLIHSNSWLMEAKQAINPAPTGGQIGTDADARAGRDWFASTKRALLAAFGVGTVDQALLGVVAARHFFVRHFALAGKVVILDEIHSYDLYTGTLIYRLINALKGLSCTVIVLSATLTGERREKIVTGFDTAVSGAELPYPLISAHRLDGLLQPVAAEPPRSRNVSVEFTSREKAEHEAAVLAKSGAAVLWICNTIQTAQNQYQRFAAQSLDGIALGLLHARFPFFRREELEEEWMKRFGKDGKTRCGSILVSTQVVEQSVDLDADLMITELAPTDMLLQRLGRLWRHERSRRPVDSATLYILEENKSLDDLRRMEPRAILGALGSKARVYAPYLLLRSLEVWEEQSRESGGVCIPSQIRQLIESTYVECETDPDSWQALSNEWFGTQMAKQMLAFRNSNLWQLALEDREGVQTRLNEIPTFALILCREKTQREIIFLDHSKAPFGADQYQLSTAQKIHRNLVKVPDYCMDSFESSSPFPEYVREKHCVGIVADSGLVEVKGIKTGFRLIYSHHLGLVIEKTSAQEEL